MAWIESHTVLLRHRKIKELARALRLRPAYVMGHLHSLWHAALEQQEDGDLSSWSDELIAESSDFPGDAPQFVRLLQDTGWLDGKLIHDWLDYAGRYLTTKYKTSNPKRLKEIYKKHKLVFSQTKVEPKSDNLTLPNLTKPTGQKEITGIGPWDEIYEAYRDKIRAGAREDAVKSIRRLIQGGIEPATLLGCVENYADYVTAQETETQFRIQANNFFGRGARYKEFLKPVVLQDKSEIRRKKVSQQLEEIDYAAGGISESGSPVFGSLPEA